LYIQNRRRLYITKDIKSPLQNNPKLSELYTCAFQHWKTNYRIGEQYYPSKRNVIDYIKTKPDYFEFYKVKGDWRIRAKITPLLNYIGELIILNGENPSHTQLLQEMLKSNKDKLRTLLDSKPFRDHIVYDKGFNSTKDIINLIGLLATISYTSILLAGIERKKLLSTYGEVTDLKKLEKITQEVTNKTFKNINKINKFLSEEQIKTFNKNYTELHQFIIQLSSFKPLFLNELSKITIISSYANILILGTFAMVKTIDEL